MAGRKRTPGLNEVFYRPEEAGRLVPAVAGSEQKLRGILTETDTIKAAQALFKWWDVVQTVLNEQQEGTTAAEYLATFVLKMEPMIQKIGSRLFQLAESDPSQSHLYSQYFDEIHLWLVTEKMILWQAALLTGIFVEKGEGTRPR